MDYADSVDGTWREKNVVMWQSRSVRYGAERAMRRGWTGSAGWRFPPPQKARYRDMKCGGGKDNDTKSNKMMEDS